VRRLIATVFNYSVDGLLADEGTPFWDFAFSLPENQRPDDAGQLAFLRDAHAHLMGRTAYEGISQAMTANTDHPFSPILNAAPKVVVSRTMATASWANTTIATGDTTAEVNRLRQGGDGYIVVWGGVTLFRSLMELDLLDELRVSLYPYISGKGTRLFDGAPASYPLELVSSAGAPNGVVELVYRRPR
jgi:dihydrofolate reductase